MPGVTLTDGFELRLCQHTRVAGAGAKNSHVIHASEKRPHVGVRKIAQTDGVTVRHQAGIQRSTFNLNHRRIFGAAIKNHVVRHARAVVADREKNPFVRLRIGWTGAGAEPVGAEPEDAGLPAGKDDVVARVEEPSRLGQRRAGVEPALQRERTERAHTHDVGRHERDAAGARSAHRGGGGVVKGAVADASGNSRGIRRM